MSNEPETFETERKPADAYSREELARVMERTLDRMDTFETKYRELVWYARRNPSDEVNAAERARVQADYPQETGKLANEHGDWHHGFNSGCLAAVRLFSAYLDVLSTTDAANQYLEQLQKDDPTDNEADMSPWQEDDFIQEAEEEFPFLDC